MTKKRKALFVATVDSHIELFHLPYLKMLKKMGYEVHVATNTNKKIKYCDKKIKLQLSRSPFSFSNLKAISELKKIIKDEKYDIVHCHTPMGGVATRLAAKVRKETRVIYTVHGFHFYSGAPFYYWILFYPIEKYLAKYTDTLITINDEDYKLAQRKFKKRCSDIRYVPGVGVNIERFKNKISNDELQKLKRTLGIDDDDIVIICVGRLDKNKNQGFLIKVLQKLLEENEKYKLLLVGPDELDGKYQKEAKEINHNVIFTGFRNDIPKLFQISNIAVSASKREGLPVNIIEAAMSGLPIVMLKCRGCKDIEKNYNNIHVVDDSIENFVKAIKKAKKEGMDERTKIFASENIEKKMRQIYEG